MSKKSRKQSKSAVGARGFRGDANSGALLVFRDGNWALFGSVYMPHPTEYDRVYFALRQDSTEIHLAGESYVRRIAELQAAGLIVVNFQVIPDVVTYYIVPSPHVPLNFFIDLMTEQIGKLDNTMREDGTDQDETADESSPPSDEMPSADEPVITEPVNDMPAIDETTEA